MQIEVPGPVPLDPTREFFVDRVRAVGYQVRFRAEEGQRSWCNPVTQTIWLRATADLDTPSGLALLAHEAVHAVQQTGPWWRRWLWGLRYLADPFFRENVEVEAEAWWAATVIRAKGIQPSRTAAREWAERSHTLGGIRAPHYTIGAPDAITTIIAARVLHLLGQSRED